jgi:hypothetical protein
VIKGSNTEKEVKKKQKDTQVYQGLGARQRGNKVGEIEVGRRLKGKKMLNNKLSGMKEKE